MCKVLTTAILTRGAGDCGIKCRDISERQFELIVSELLTAVSHVNEVEIVIGLHERYGATTLVRDGSRCIVLVNDAACLDRVSAEQAFLTSGVAAEVAGRG